MNKQTIYISAYPKSGSTWLTRLLGDVLNSPTGGCMPKYDRTEIATGGQSRPGKYVVRKGHFILVDNGGDTVVSAPHKLNWKALTNEKIILLVRDPRDICVSGSFHWLLPIDVFLKRMLKGKVARRGRWDKFNSDYLDIQPSFIRSFANSFTIIRYEDLLQDTFGEITKVVNSLNLDKPTNKRIKEAIGRQSFKRKKKQIGNSIVEMRRQNIRKGIAGDWKNHFSDEMNNRIWSEFGWMMKRLGYRK